MMHVQLTRRWPDKVEREIAKLAKVEFNQADVGLSPGELGEALARVDILCTTVTDTLDAEMLSARDVRTRLIANFGVGYNNIDIEAATAAGIAVTNTPGVLTEATAELALSLLLASARRTGEGERELRAGHWEGWRPTYRLGTEVTGKTLGIVGMGRIGVALARKAHHGLGMKIYYMNRNRVSEEVESELGAEWVPLDELLVRSDFVSLHCPATPDTRHLIDGEALRKMQSHAHLINTAWGEIVDEPALVQALETGVIAGAGLDVYENEPILTEGLIDQERAVLLPHVGSGTVETREAMGFCAMQNVKAFVDGEPLPNQVN